ncbi:hypothetical protein NL676_025847 [Syzygium grande]|nr:hypothetical protein NL676_025847 [Syzygium grande]
MHPPGGGGHHTAVIAACASLGGLFMLALLGIGLFCLAKRRKRPVMVPGLAPCVDREEREVVREAITTGPYGEQAVTVDIEDDTIIHSGAVGGDAAGASYGGASRPPYEPSHPPGYDRPY